MCVLVHKKINRSGTTSVIVVSKSKGVFKELATIGVSNDEQKIEQLYRQHRNWIEIQTGTQDVFKEHTRAIEEEKLAKYFLSNPENILLNGPQLILDQAFRLIGFDSINDDILKHLIIARICQPLSKSGTVEYLKSYFDEDVELHKIYRFLDKLHQSQHEKIQQISVAYTRKIVGGKIGLIFYDATTLYFETDESDDLREKGWSKHGKHSQLQVVLGLLVSRDDYPLAYSLFNGSQYEGRTMIPIVEDFVKRFELEGFVAVFDSGLMNKTNIALPESAGYKYIIGARIKNEADEIKQWILSQCKQDGVFLETAKDQTRLIVSYSDKRTRKTDTTERRV